MPRELYEKIAVWMTTRENHQTATQHEDALILKVQRRASV
jgi:hypothetical protein